MTRLILRAYDALTGGDITSDDIAPLAVVLILAIGLSTLVLGLAL